MEKRRAKTKNARNVELPRGVATSGNPGHCLFLCEGRMLSNACFHLLLQPGGPSRSGRVLHVLRQPPHSKLAVGRGRRGGQETLAQHEASTTASCWVMEQALPSWCAQAFACADVPTEILDGRFARAERAPEKGALNRKRARAWSCSGRCLGGWKA